MKKDVLSPCEVRVETGRHLNQGGETSVITIRPLVGFMMRLRIFRAVLLPAPLWPMMPNASPRFTSNERSCKAQNSRSSLS